MRDTLLILFSYFPQVVFFFVLLHGLTLGEYSNREKAALAGSMLVIFVWTALGLTVSLFR